MRVYVHVNYAVDVNVIFAGDQNETSTDGDRTSPKDASVETATTGDQKRTGAGDNGQSTTEPSVQNINAGDQNETGTEGNSQPPTDKIIGTPTTTIDAPNVTEMCKELEEEDEYEYELDNTYEEGYSYEYRK
ncbi:hypothetical protein HPB50_009590 [Hyalomma asiaticum]|uniref:Uncharacterized protein n=1 Tax=Hyalomma asiaticum TaxID=266040 RepID=A0ACB7T9D5_HYAAI|nr:hypothetical protein HPB50_009590 [Hyalomma asiaticum]